MYVFMGVHMCAGAHRCQKRAATFGARVTGSCELLCGCWELNLDLFEELQVL